MSKGTCKERMKLVMAFLVWMLPALPAMAGGVIGATVTQVATTRGAFFVWVDSPISNNASCNTQARFAANPNDANGRAMISQILAAWSGGHKVNIDGTGNCDVWPDTESINVIYAY